MNPIKLQQLAHSLWQKHLHLPAKVIQKFIHVRYNCDLPPQAAVGGGTSLGHGGIGVVINGQSVIGRNCIIAQNVTIAGKNGKAPVIDDWVYIGANSVVLGNVSVGKNVFIGALTLVNKDVPDNSVVAGIPAKIIKLQTEEQIKVWHNEVLAQGGVPIET